MFLIAGKIVLDFVNPADLNSCHMQGSEKQPFCVVVTNVFH